MNIYFDTKNIYYLPQYEPVIDKLIDRGHSCSIVVYADKNDKTLVDHFVSRNKTQLLWVENEEAALACYLEARPDWIFFANQFSGLDLVHEHSKTAQLGHGVGPKPSYYTKSNTPMTVRFVEGYERFEKIQKMYPDDHFEQVGFSKLDPVFNGKKKGIDLESVGLDPNAKTILYAPTFNPSSIECFPDDWPDQFSEYNIMIKAHAFSYSRKRYFAHRKKLAQWGRFKNTYIAKGSELSLVPFMVNADILLSEASSTLFEFAAMNKPVVVCNFFHLKWFYRGIFKYRFDRRFRKNNVHFEEIGQHVDRYERLKSAVDHQLNNLQEYEHKRLEMTRKHIGQVDGRASERIVAFLESH